MDNRARDILSMMVSLLKTEKTWTFSDTPQGAVVIVDLDSDQGPQEWERLATLDCIRVAFTTQPDSVPVGAMALKKPLRSTELLPLLNRLGNDLLTQMTAMSAAPTPTVSAEPLAQPRVVAPSTTSANNNDTPSRRPEPPVAKQPIKASAIQHGFIPESSHPLLKLLHTATNTSGLHTITAERRVLLLDPHKRRYHVLQGGTDLQPLFYSSNVLVNKQTGNELPLPHHDLEVAIWQALLSLTPARLLPELEGVSYRLRRWPDFKRLGHDGSLVRPTMVLTRQAISFEQLVQSSGVPAARLPGFLNACFALGYLEASRHEAATPASPTLKAQSSATANSGKLGLLGRIRSRLGL